MPDTLLDLIIEAMEHFGGKAHYSDLYTYLEALYPDRCTSSWWRHSVQKVVELHCPQAKNWHRLKNKPAWHFDNVAKGTYRIIFDATKPLNETIGEPTRCRYERHSATVVTDAIHRDVCAALIAEAKRFLIDGSTLLSFYALNKDRFVDLQIVDTDSRVPVLTFEVKSTSARHDLYTAVGQVLMHGRSAKRDAGVAIVRPASLIGFERDLRALNIRSVMWRQVDRNVVFTGLRETLDEYVTPLPRRKRYGGQ